MGLWSVLWTTQLAINARSAWETTQAEHHSAMVVVLHLTAGAKDVEQEPARTKARTAEAKELVVEKARTGKVKAAEDSSSRTSGKMQATILGTTGDHDLIVATGKVSTPMQSQ